MAGRTGWPVGLNSGSHEGTRLEFGISGSSGGKWRYLDDKSFEKVALSDYSPIILTILS
jgi:hypothetical protein